MNHPRPAAPEAMPSASLLGVTRPLAIPAVLKRNTLLLATAQAFVGVGNQMVPTLGAIMVTQLLGSPALAGLATSVLGGCRFLVAYPAGHVADTYGRRAGLLAGLLLTLVGAIAVGLALMQHAFLGFLGGLVLFGLGVGAGQQLRLAAADLYPPSRRAEGLGYVLMGSLVGALGGPLLISAAQTIAPALGLEPLALAWLLIPLIVLPSLGLVWSIHPISGGCGTAAPAGSCRSVPPQPAGGRSRLCPHGLAGWRARWATPDQCGADDSASARAGASGPRLAAHPAHRPAEPRARVVDPP